MDQTTYINNHGSQGISGLFTLPRVGTYPGTLYLTRERAHLHVWLPSRETNSVLDSPFTAHGVINDRQSVTMLNCSTHSITRFSADGVDKRKHIIHSNLMLTGYAKFDPLIDSIREIQWRLSDCRNLFGIYDVAPPDEPEPLFSCDTSFGHLDILHNHHPEFKLRVAENAPLSDMILHMQTISRFFGLVFGKRMSIWGCQIRAHNANGDVRSYTLSFPSTEQNNYFVTDSTVLLHPMHHLKQIGEMLRAWTASSNTRRRSARDIARDNVLLNWGTREYPDLRLVRAISSIDWIGIASLDALAGLTEKQKPLQVPEGTSRGTTKLNSKGTVDSSGSEGTMEVSKRRKPKKVKIRDKIKLRVNGIADLLPLERKDLLDVANEAVDYRNFIIHGGEWICKNYTPKPLIFYIDTIEFIFLASELKCCGWNEGLSQRIRLYHPFDQYIRTFRKMLLRDPLRGPHPLKMYVDAGVL